LPQDAPQLLRGHLDTAEEVVQASVNEIRGYCEELSPSWARLGLAPALEENANRVSRAYDGVEIDVDIGMDLQEDPFPEGHVLALSRIFQEAASNSVRHGRARFIQVELRKEGDSILFSIQDDGSGFDAEAYAGTDYEVLRTTGHRGLANINERVRLLHGTMRLESRPGEGCRIEIVFPNPSS
jgi:signal transduction histidine kinase